jgi:hypothetical protein
MADRNCTVDGCTRTLRSPKADLCNAHFSDRKRKPCSVDGCPDLACGLGLCSRHYQRYKSHGSVSTSVQHYQPMCVPCHKTFDLDHLQSCRSSPA